MFQTQCDQSLSTNLLQSGQLVAQPIFPQPSPSPPQSQLKLTQQPRYLPVTLQQQIRCQVFPPSPTPSMLSLVQNTPQTASNLYHSSQNSLFSGSGNVVKMSPNNNPNSPSTTLTQLPTHQHYLAQQSNTISPYKHLDQSFGLPSSSQQQGRQLTQFQSISIPSSLPTVSSSSSLSSLSSSSLLSQSITNQPPFNNCHLALAQHSPNTLQQRQQQQQHQPQLCSPFPSLLRSSNGPIPSPQNFLFGSSLNSILSQLTIKPRVPINTTPPATINLNNPNKHTSFPLLMTSPNLIGPFGQPSTQTTSPITSLPITTPHIPTNVFTASLLPTIKDAKPPTFTANFVATIVGNSAFVQHPPQPNTIPTFGFTIAHLHNNPFPHPPIRSADDIVQLDSSPQTQQQLFPFVSYPVLSNETLVMQQHDGQQSPPYSYLQSGNPIHHQGLNLLQHQHHQQPHQGQYQYQQQVQHQNQQQSQNQHQDSYHDLQQLLTLYDSDPNLTTPLVFRRQETTEDYEDEDNDEDVGGSIEPSGPVVKKNCPKKKNCTKKKNQTPELLLPMSSTRRRSAPIISDNIGLEAPGELQLGIRPLVTVSPFEDPSYVPTVEDMVHDEPSVDSFPSMTSCSTALLIYQLCILSQRYHYWLQQFPSSILTTEQQHQAKSYLQGKLLDVYFHICHSSTNSSETNPFDFEITLPYPNTQLGISNEDFLTHQSNINDRSPMVAGGLIVPLDGVETTARFEFLKTEDLRQILRRALPRDETFTQLLWSVDRNRNDSISHIERCTWLNPHSLTLTGVGKVLEEAKSTRSANNWTQRRQVHKYLTERWDVKVNIDNRGTRADVKLRTERWFHNRLPDRGPHGNKPHSYYLQYKSFNRRIWGDGYQGYGNAGDGTTDPSLYARHRHSPGPFYSGSIDDHLTVAKDVGYKTLTTEYVSRQNYTDRCRKSYLIAIDLIPFKDNSPLVDINCDVVETQQPLTIEMVMGLVYTNGKADQDKSE